MSRYDRKAVPYCRPFGHLHAGAPFLLQQDHWHTLDGFGEHSMRMAEAYAEGAGRTGAINLVAGVLWDFRGYDTLGEAVVLFTAAIGVVTIFRLTGKN
jgi:hypothetical protein